MPDIGLDAIKITIGKAFEGGEAAMVISKDGHTLDFTVRAGEIIVEDERARSDVFDVPNMDLTETRRDCNLDTWPPEAVAAFELAERLWEVGAKAGRAWLSLDPPIPCDGSDLGDAMVAAVKAIKAEREWVHHLEEGIRDDAERLGINIQGCVGLAICHLVVEHVEKMQGDAWDLIRRLKKEPRFQTLDEPGWMETLKRIAGPEEPDDDSMYLMQGTHNCASHKQARFIQTSKLPLQLVTSPLTLIQTQAPLIFS